MNWYTYTIKCGDNSYYVGHTHDLAKRFICHARRNGAKHTAQNGAAGLLYHEIFTSETEAIRRENQIKRWSRAKKEALIEGNINLLRASHGKGPL